MTQEFTLEKARAMETADLLVALRDGLSLSEEAIRDACVAVAVLEERDVDLPVLPEVFRFAREIAEGDVSAHAGLILGRFPFMIQAVRGLPVDLQNEIADGKRVKVAVKVDGRIQTRDLTIFEMSQQQIRLAFSEDGITPWEEQGEFLHKATPEALGEKKPTPPRIMVDGESREIIIGRSHLSVDDLIPALSALGYVVKPAYGSKQIKPAKVK